jgi:hypothetical protein
MDSISHEHAAAQLAKDYAAGDTATRRRIAETCEEQGILAALVVMALPTAAQRADFIQAMVGAVIAGTEPTE